MDGVPAPLADAGSRGGGPGPLDADLGAAPGGWSQWVRQSLGDSGRVIALEDKATLLGQGSARRDIMLRLDPPGLPPALEPLLLRREGSKVWLRLADIDQLGGVLAQVQAAGARVRDFEVVELDLEQVFVARMQGKEA